MNDDGTIEGDDGVVYKITPKGFIALNLMGYFNVTMEEAAAIAQEIEDQIFLSGYVYVHESRLLGENGEL